MRRLLVGTLVVLFVPALLAAGWKQAYFAATRPGNWATTRTTSTIGPPSTTTMTRLPDQEGRIVIDQRSEFSANTPASTMRYELESGFDADRNLIDLLSGIAGASASVGADATFTPLPADTVGAMKGMATYAATAVFKRVERVGGKSCDRYAYTRGKKGDAQYETGDIWLNASVPFGVVKHTMTFTGPTGKVLYTAETLLVDSGLKP